MDRNETYDRATEVNFWLDNLVEESKVISSTFSRKDSGMHSDLLWQKSFNPSLLTSAVSGPFAIEGTTHQCNHVNHPRARNHSKLRHILRHERQWKSNRSDDKSGWFSQRTRILASLEENSRFVQLL
jgi:hypothetical protein